MIDENRRAVKAFDAAADLYQQKYMNVSFYNTPLLMFCEHLPVDAAILDLGCGPGNFSKYLYQYSPSFKIIGIDGSQEMIRLAQLNVPEAEFIVADCREFGVVYEQFDAIICSFLLPYLNKTESEGLVLQIGEMLGDKGKLFLSFITDDQNSWEMVTSSKGDVIKLNYYSDEFIEQMLISSGFRVVLKELFLSPNRAQVKNDCVIVATKS